MKTIKLALLAATAAVLAGCADMNANTLGGVFSSKSDPRLQTMRWDGVAASADWTNATIDALENHGTALLATTPADIDSWCPGYTKGGENARLAFWTGLLSTLSKHESTWNPRAVGGGGRWFGLVQIAPSTARLYGCAAGSGEALKDGEANLSCAVRIMNHTVPRDGVVSAGMRGVAADWGPFHSATKRQDMMTYMRAQPYCAG